jgi:hypothetical protein
MNTPAFNAFRSNNERAVQNWNDQSMLLGGGACRQPQVFSTGSAALQLSQLVSIR